MDEIWGTPRALALLAAVALAVGGCGAGDESDTPARSSIPQSLRVVESGAEDTTDFILAGEREKAIRSAAALRRAAQGTAAGDLADAGVAPAQIDELQARASALMKIVAHGRAIDVALAANRAFELVPALFAVYRDRVPAQVTRLDYLDFEAKLQALAGHRRKVAGAVRGLDEVWTALRKQVVAAGGMAPAVRFDEHVRAMRRLVKRDAGTRVLAREAQHGLDLVDEVEEVYEG